MSGSLGEREIEVATRAGRACVSLNFESITYANKGEMFNFYFFYKITSRKIKRGNSRLLYQSVNSPYCS